MSRCLGLFAVLVASMLPGLGQIPDAPNPAHETFAGDDACRKCHQQQWETYRTTAHHVASRLPSRDSINGSFSPGSNIMPTSNPYLYFAMKEDAGKFSQSAVVTLPPAETITRTEPFDLVIGSGRKGQTYLYWKGDELFELPVSYWTETNQWTNSPGYPDGLPNFEKPIIPRCLECHTAFAQAVPPARNKFDKTSLLLGITCERCHGPARAHVIRTQAGTPLRPGETEDVINPASLPRDRQMDLCALCHAGPGTPKTTAFSFVVGEELSAYLSIPDTAPDAPSDVHGHQVQQLRSSRCYVSSSMTCATCHNVHKPQRDVAAFSDRCLSCHQVEKYPGHAASKILHNCVNCHMPLKQSEQIVLNTAGGKVRPEVRTHRIAIYEDAAARASNH